MLKEGDNMKRLLVLVVVGFWCLSVGLQASGGVVSSLLTQYNASDDTLTDYSWGARPDPDGAPGVVVGLARLDKVNGFITHPSNQENQALGWLLFAFEVDKVENGLVYHKPLDANSSYHPKNLLSSLASASDIGDNAMLVLLERNAPPTGDLLDLVGNTFYPWDASGNPDPVDLIDAIGVLNNSATTTWLASFGITQDGDYLTLDAWVGGKYKTYEDISLSLVSDNPNDSIVFKQGAINFAYTRPNTGSINVSRNTPDDGATMFYDSGVLYVNAVPEPTSVVALLGLGSMAVASYVARRRKS